MDLEKIGHRALLSWISMGLLVALVCILAALQYRWIGEISRTEQKTLQESLQAELNALSRDFNSQINTAVAALLPSDSEVDQLGRAEAYQAHYERWKEANSNTKLFRRIAAAGEENGKLTLWMLDPETGSFDVAEWPKSWVPTRDFIAQRLAGGPPRVLPFETSSLIDIPRFRTPVSQQRGRGGAPPRFGTFGDPSRFGGGGMEQDWLLAEVDTNYVSTVVLPDLLTRYLGRDYQSKYRVAAFPRSNSTTPIYQSDSLPNPPRGRSSDASVTFFEATRQFGRTGSEGRGGRGVSDPSKGPPPPSDSGRGRWQLAVRSQAGSLAAVVANARTRNIAVSAAILLLLLTTGAALVRFTRQAQRLAEVEMEFVAGVSHELRTPLTVIRTAAFNLRGKMAGSPAQVEKYGTLIQHESEKLTGIVEQVLRFASAKAGRVVRERQPVAVDSLIEESLSSSRNLLEETLCQVEKRIDPGLPLISGDSAALRHALQNLINNAVKYGSGGAKWIGIFAREVPDGKGRAIEIQVADHGPGIPPEEQKHVFDAFFRGEKAVRDQVHGTGLGLNLVKKIVEAHGGTVSVHSEPGSGTTFNIRIPAGAVETQDEFAHSLG
jgi:signal transduction histidine kinase